MTTKQVLEMARSIIENPEHWTQGSYAIDHCGSEVYPDESNAYAFCSAGALAKVTGTTFDSEDGQIIETLEFQAGYAALKEAAYTLTGFNSVTSLNDGDAPEIAHPKVLAMFDKAIEQSSQ